MKRIYAMVVIGMLWTSIGFAEVAWENIKDDGSLYISPVRIVVIGTQEIAKAKIKSVNKDGTYDIYYYKVNIDSKDYVMYQWEKHADNDAIIDQYASKRESWEPGNLKNAHVAEIVKRVP